MAYIGRQNLGGAYRQLDDISSGFDGSDTTHTMQVNSANVTVGDVNQIILSLGGVIQKPGTDFTVSGSVLTFTTAPAANTSFFAVLLGSDNGGTVTPTDVSVTKAKLADEIDIFVGTSLSAADLGTGIHIKTADSGVSSAGVNGDELIIEGSGHAGLSIFSGTSSNGVIHFGDSGASADGYILYDHSNRKLDFGSASATQWSIDSSGNLLPAATDHGIYLGVSSATAANLLDDYEEGTWTPSNSDVTLSVTSATYVKVGHLCHVQAYVTFPSNSNGSGAQIEGLPFTAGGGYAYLTGRAEGQSSQIVIQVNSGTTESDVYNEADAGLANSALSGSYFLFSGTYVTT
jgi:hypothetical protein